MATTPTNFSIFVSNANTYIGEVYEETNADIGILYEEFMTTMPSSSSQNIYAWTQMIPKPRLWAGPRVVVEPSALTYTLVNRPWELTVGIDRFMLDDDQFGVYYRMLIDQARQLRRLPDYWGRDLLEATGVYASGQPGSPQNGLDGTPFFGTAHVVDPYNPNTTTYCNDFTGGGQSIAGGVPGGSGSNITVGGTFGVTAFATLYEYMLRELGEDLEPLGVVPNKLMVPVTLKTEAELVLKSSFFAPPAFATINNQVGAADNPFLRFGVQLMVNPYLTSGTKWYLMDTQRTIKPMIWQLREASTIIPRVNMQDPVSFDTHRYLWGGEGRGTPGWGYSFLMSRSGS
jgi:phage major head subunit gpT-like protein